MRKHRRISPKSTRRRARARRATPQVGPYPPNRIFRGLARSGIIRYRKGLNSELKNKLARVKTLADPLQRKLWALAEITKGLEPAGLRPILIGGTALEYYSLGGDATADVDIALPQGHAVDEVLNV